MSVLSQNRKRLIRTYGSLYKRADVDLSVCVYCGDDRYCLDHVPPISWIETFDIKKYKKRGGELLLYPACRQCNAWLGGKQLFDLKGRLQFLYERYMKEVDRINGLWSDDEIKEMSYVFQTMILSKREATKDLIRKFRKIEDKIMSIEGYI